VRDAVTTILEVLGLVIVAVGVGLIFAPVGVIVGGVELVLVGYLSGRQ
jgi:hypothetical protein